MIPTCMSRSGMRGRPKSQALASADIDALHNFYYAWLRVPAYRTAYDEWRQRR